MTETKPVWMDQLEPPSPENLTLSNTEIRQLQILAENNGPLARMMKFFLDSATKLSQDVFNVDILTDDGRNSFLRAQAQYRALHAQRALLMECLTTQETSAANQENADD